MFKTPKEVIEFKNRFAGLYDSRNINVFDPDDSLGFKTYYIHLIQELVIRRMLSSRTWRFGIDFSCGNGRITTILADYCENVVGMDIDEFLIGKAEETSAKKNISYLSFQPGAYPTLGKKADIIICGAAFHMKAIGDEIPQVINYFREIISDDGRIIIVENCVEKSNEIYFSPKDLIKMFEKAGFSTRLYHPIRKGHTVTTYLVRYGFVRSVERIRKIAENEIVRRAAQKTLGNDYFNFIFEFAV